MQKFKQIYPSSSSPLETHRAMLEMRFPARREGSWSFPGRQCGSRELLLWVFTCSFGADECSQGHDREARGNLFR